MIGSIVQVVHLCCLAPRVLDLLGVATALYRGNRSSRGDSPGTTGVRAVLSTIPISE